MKPNTRGLVWLAMAWPLLSLAMDPAEMIPRDAPDDEVMAGAAEVEAWADWASAVFTGERLPGHTPQVGVVVLRQDHSVLRFGQSCMETPLRLGTNQYARGLGTHANSELLLRLPPGARAFKAVVGVDNNFDTGGQRGSVQFAVVVGDQELYRSPTRRASDAPLPVNVALPEGTRELLLKVDTTPDGPAHDQADWADAHVILADGRVAWADEDRQMFLAPELPFSFLLNGVPSAKLLPQWPRTHQSKIETGRTVRTVSWTDPASGLRVTATVTTFKRYPAVEWLVQFEHTGAQDSPLIEQVQALDLGLRSGYYRKPLTLHQVAGDVCGEQSFVPSEKDVEPNQPLSLAPVGGRSSNQTFPFFNVRYGEEGVIVGIGWSGQWAARIERSAAGPSRLRAGQELTRLRLHPGERIRSPRILLMPWQGDRLWAHNRFRRLLLFEYVPRVEGRPTPLPVALQCFDRYSWNRPEWSTEAGQLEAARAAQAMGFDTHWFDAAWFEGGFPNGVGNWFCRPQAFPRGLRPVGDQCHQLGLKFLVWFEPERVAPGSQIAREHPEFVWGGTQGGLFKLDHPAARQWLTDLLSSRLREFGIDDYRNDFNLDPLPHWRAADAPDRQGLTEIRYVEGHYALWDELRARQPGLFIDNCASGGRRIDLETLMRSVPLWRSDTGCSPGHADWDQTQALGLSLYVPLFASCAWEPTAYVLRSSAAAGIIGQFDYLDPKFSTTAARSALAEVQANRPYWYGDFYPITRAAVGQEAWAAWQLHRPDLRAGIILAFRRAASPYPVLQVGLRGLSPEQTYRLELIDENRALTQRTVPGRELLSDFPLELPRRGTSLLVRYGVSP